MKTADDMYKYCSEHGFGSGFIVRQSLNHFSIISQSLQPDEEVLMTFIGLHNYISATKHDGYFAYAITTKRIIIAKKKIIGEFLNTVLLNNLNDITLNSGLVFGVVTFDTISERFNVGVAKSIASNILSESQRILLDIKSGHSPNTVANTNNISSADEIMKFKNMLDSGVITQDEFDAKKKQLLRL